MHGVTQQQFRTLEDLYAYYNRRLFAQQLPDCLITLARHRRAAGYFMAQTWRSRDGKLSNEIAINPDTLHIGDQYWHSTLVHEMCHLWQHEFGKPSRYSYHNREWAQKMIEVGLMPSDTGEPGGKQTGQRISDYVIPGGVFDRAFLEIDQEALKQLQLPYLNNQNPITGNTNEEVELVDETDLDTTVISQSKSGVKKKYTCECGSNVWGKSGLLILCLECNTDFIEEG